MNEQILAQKQGVVSEISASMQEAKSITVVEYRGLTVKDLEELRKVLRENHSELKVYKNTLVTIAGKGLGYDELEQHLQGPNAFVFSNEDETSAPKALIKFAKKHDELVVKAGVVDGKVLDAAQMAEVAKLPGKNGLISMFLSCLNAPITKFAATVKAVADAKQ